MKSMTGFGRGVAKINGWQYIAEVKTLNHRYYDVSIRLPHVLNPLEDRARKLLAQHIRRGKTEVFVRTAFVGGEDVAAQSGVHWPAAAAFAEAVQELGQEFGFSAAECIAMLSARPALLHDPPAEAFDPKADEVFREAAWAALSEALTGALDQCNAMRVAEGKTVRDDILATIERITGLVGRCKTQGPEVLVRCEVKLRERLAEVLTLLQGFRPDEARLVTELALLADKFCINEELSRIDSHIKQLYHMVNEGNEPVGRKLDFLMQELNREANTVGVKSGDDVLARYAVELKSEIEKIRKQVQNVE